MDLKQTDIVLLSAPYSDDSLRKMRPTIVVSNNEINSGNEDVLVIPLTSQLKDNLYSVFIGKEELSEGKLRFASMARADKIFTISKNLIKHKIGSIDQSILSKIQKKMIKSIGN